MFHMHGMMVGIVWLQAVTGKAGCKILYAIGRTWYSNGKCDRAGVVRDETLE